jgi:predicted O-methyltransferase YrrM
MRNRTIQVDARLADYIEAHTPPEPEPLRRLREETSALGTVARMQIGVDQGHFLGLVVRMLGARRVLEIGTFTGYSAMAMALALPEGGRVLTCDISEDWTRIARRHWDAAGIGERIELRLGPAVATLEELLARGEEGSWDLAFIDGDKGNYAAYWERCVRLVRPGGAILVDNVLWSGRVADPSDRDPDTVAIRELNAKIRDDARVARMLLAAFDGLTVAVVLPRTAPE